MHLVSLNVEGFKHEKCVFDFLSKENPDVICLQEAPADFIQTIEALGYYTHLGPRCIREFEGRDFLDGVLIATKTPANFSTHFYYRGFDETPKEIFDPKTGRKTNNQVFVLAVTTIDGQVFTIGCNHFTWTPEGHIPNQTQKDDMAAFLNMTKSLPPHLMCGDFNIPRHLSPLYKSLTEFYSDNIPESYVSSLDKNLHRHGANPDKDNLFTDYMVDYVFTQPPYSAHDVRLEFGISDHAAVVAHILHA